MTSVRSSPTSSPARCCRRSELAFSGATQVERPTLALRISEHVAVFVMLVLIVAFIGLVSVLYITHTTAKVDGGSMKPGLLPEDILLVTRGYDRPLRGDIVVFRAPASKDLEPDSELVKRVVGLPGDEVQVVAGVAYVNGEVEKGSYTVATWPGDIGLPLTRVPEGHLFLLGDNRAVSVDSRMIGPVPLELVIGRVESIIAPINRFGRVD